MSISISAAAVALALAAQPAVVSPPDDVTVLDEVVVPGRVTQDVVEGFVSSIAAPAYRQGLAIWNRDICVGAANFSPEHAQFVIDRVSRLALLVGLTPGSPGCKANVLVIASADPKTLASDLVRADESAFRPTSGSSNRGKAALDRFQNTDAPVRWWHVSLPVSEDTGQTAVAIGGIHEGPSWDGNQPTYQAADRPITTVTISGMSTRLRSGIRQDLKRAIVIVDASALEPVNMRDLADYVGMVALAQIDLDTDTRDYPTVLNLFEGGDFSHGLTDWDLSYLRALYLAPADRAQKRHQTNALTNIMTSEYNAANLD